MIGVAGPFAGAVIDVHVVSTGVVVASIVKVAVAEAVLPTGSERVNDSVELCPEALSVGRNRRPVSCVTVRTSPKEIGVTPSDSSTVPSAGKEVIVAVKEEAAKLESVGVAIPIDVAKLFSATLSEVTGSLMVDMREPF